jgi:hypothetical protein
MVAAAFVLTHILARKFGVPGPGTWAVLCALAVASWSLRRAGMRWDELGMRAPENWWIALAWVAALYAAAALAKGAHGLADSLGLIAIYARIARVT